MKVPISELREMEERMRAMAKVNENDMRDYLFNNKYDQYIQAKAHKYTNEFWANRVADIIEKYEGVKDDE